MKFTFNEWQSILHDLEVARDEYVKTMNECKSSDEEYSMYQIFKRQIEQTNEFINRIKNTEI